MLVSDLKQKNNVNVDGTVRTVIHIYDNNITFDNAGVTEEANDARLTDLPITKTWLTNNGFTLTPPNLYELKIGDNAIKYDFATADVIYNNGKDNMIIKNTIATHKLQNIISELK